MCCQRGACRERPSRLRPLALYWPHGFPDDSGPPRPRSPPVEELLSHLARQAVVLGSLSIVSTLPALVKDGKWHRAVWAQLFDSVRRTRILRVWAAPVRAFAGGSSSEEHKCLGRCPGRERRFPKRLSSSDTVSEYPEGCQPARGLGGCNLRGPASQSPARPLARRA